MPIRFLLRSVRLRLRFGECVLDTYVHLLTRAGRTVALSPKGFALLAALAERRPRVVPRAELRRLVWPEAVVGGTTLARLVNEVRRAVGDSAARGGVVRTVPRVGYAFSAAAVEGGSARTPGRCALQWGDRRVPLAEGENVIGRADDAAISVASSKISRRHARIVVERGRATLEDLGSKNGTFLGERRVEAPVELRHGDRIVIGPVELTFRVSTAEEVTSPNPPHGTGT
jgi:DNA-binding winged helix-turn-helix (wHTH) protein